MRFVKVERDGAIAGGLLDGDNVHIIGEWTAGIAEEIPFALSRRLGDIARLQDEVRATVPLSTVKLAVPVDPLAKIICVGMNYRDHVGEISLEIAAYPTIFTRSLDSLSPTGADIVRPSVSETFDFEGEIAVVIGRAGRHIAVDDAMSHVGGYSCFMDGSVREYQRHSLTAGKNFHRSGSRAWQPQIRYSRPLSMAKWCNERMRAR